MQWVCNRFFARLTMLTVAGVNAKTRGLGMACSRPLNLTSIIYFSPTNWNLTFIRSGEICSTIEPIK